MSNFDLGNIEGILCGPVEEINLSDMEYSESECAAFDMMIASTVGTSDMQTALKDDQPLFNTSASRFKKLDEKDLKELEGKRTAASTKKNTRWALKMFQGKSLHQQKLFKCRSS